MACSCFVAHHRTMSLLSIPLEILEDIGCHLHSKDVFSLMLASRHLYVSLVNHLYRVARTYRLQHAKSLTDGLRDVSFWFDKEGNGTVLEWAAIHGQYNTFERLLSEPGRQGCRGRSRRSSLHSRRPCLSSDPGALTPRRGCSFLLPSLARHPWSL